jgi:hypothetical protein
MSLYGEKIFKVKPLKERRNELSQSRYQTNYEDLCDLRQDTINHLIKMEDVKEGGIGG